MKSNRKNALKSLRLLVCLMAFYVLQLPAVTCQELVEPITKDRLIRSIRANKVERRSNEKLTAAGYVKLINRYGVDFSLTAEDEQEIRSAGEYLGRPGLDNLIAAIRDKYRPDEPTEEEMQEAVLRTWERRGGQRDGKRTIEVNNVIAGVSAEIERFEKMDCKPATSGAGYECTYNITISQTYHSNEGSQAGANHADAWNRVLGALGLRTANETATSRFVWSKEGWIMSKL